MLRQLLGEKQLVFGYSFGSLYTDLGFADLLDYNRSVGEFVTGTSLASFNASRAASAEQESTSNKKLDSSPMRLPTGIDHHFLNGIGFVKCQSKSSR